MRKLAMLLCLGALAPVTLAACGGGDDETTTSAAPTTTTTAAGGGGGGGATVSVSADPSGALKFQQSSLSAKAGSDTFNFDNPASLGHDFCIKDSSGKELGCSDVVTDGSSTLSANLKAGTYTFYCNVDGHEAAGMKGTLTVK
jgi:plastocyanin